MFKCGLDDLAGKAARFAHAQASDGVTAEPNLNRAFRGLSPEVAVHTALYDSEESLGRAFPRQIISLGRTSRVPWNLSFVLLEICF
jgi:hypothetical protein